MFREIIVKKLPVDTFKALTKIFRTPCFTFPQILEGLDQLIEALETYKEKETQQRKLKRESKFLQVATVTTKAND